MKLEAKEISFRYQTGSRQILNKFSLEIDSREQVGLIAPSGFGKTTFCKILAGYERPDGGSVLLDGRPLEEFGSYCPVQMIWQHPELSVNPKRRMKTVLEEGDRITRDIIRGLGIEEGERTRFLLADEITTMLDLITQSQIWQFLLEETRRREIGLLVVSHSRPLINRICTRKVEMEPWT